MQTKLFKNNWVTTMALLLAMPAGYFILSSVLKFTFNINEPYDLIAPLVEPKQFSIANLLILFGPLLAILLTIFQVLTIELRFSKEEVKLNLVVTKRWFPLLVIGFAGFIVAILVFYYQVENCNCH